VRPEWRPEIEKKSDRRDDVQGVLVILYQYITRGPSLSAQYILQDLDENHFKDPAKWIKHPDVDLDDDVAEFYFELMAWVRSRQAHGTLYRVARAHQLAQSARS
jgi:hypothetical protein